MRVGEIDPRCVGDTNEPPTAHPGAGRGAHLEAGRRRRGRRSRGARSEAPATVTITGFPDRARRHAALARPGHDPDLERPGGRAHLLPGRAADALRGGEGRHQAPRPGQVRRSSPGGCATWPRPTSRVLMTGLHTCANCHSFSRDGTTLGMDLDGPQNDKGLYALVPIQPQTTIRSEDVVAWSSFRGKLGGKLRVGFMSQVSPDGRYVVTTHQRPRARARRTTSVARPPRTCATTTSPTSRTTASSRCSTRRAGSWPGTAGTTGQLAAAARAPTTRATCRPTPSGARTGVPGVRPGRGEGRLPRGRRSSPSTPTTRTRRQIQYDLYRIPFNEGRGGRGGARSPAPRGNGMSNTLPEGLARRAVDRLRAGRNGQLMRPDGKLYIVPVEGGEARRMRCNTPLMNSWHSFSPNGRWMVFSSKSRSPYTQMFLTHLDEDGQRQPGDPDRERAPRPTAR